MAVLIAVGLFAASTAVATVGLQNMKLETWENLP
jgi:hypothetical protein